MSESDFELARLQKENSRLKLLCVGLALIFFFCTKSQIDPGLMLGMMTAAFSTVLAFGRAMRVEFMFIIRMTWALWP